MGSLYSPKTKNVSFYGAKKNISLYVPFGFSGAGTETSLRDVNAEES